MNKELYTFVLEYYEGTYISQVYAENLEDSIHEWFKNLNYEDVYGMGKKSYSRLEKEISDPDETPVLLDGLKNAWCIGYTINNRLALINIIKTSE